jgi:regulator of replication initiation timing
MGMTFPGLEEIKRLHKEIDGLQAGLEVLQRCCDTYLSENERLQTENEKLEMQVKMWELTYTKTQTENAQMVAFIAAFEVCLDRVIAGYGNSTCDCVWAFNNARDMFALVKQEHGLAKDGDA